MVARPRPGPNDTGHCPQRPGRQSSSTLGQLSLEGGVDPEVQGGSTRGRLSLGGGADPEESKLRQAGMQQSRGWQGPSLESMCVNGPPAPLVKVTDRPHVLLRQRRGADHGAAQAAALRQAIQRVRGGREVGPAARGRRVQQRPSWHDLWVLLVLLALLLVLLALLLVLLLQVLLGRWLRRQVLACQCPGYLVGWVQCVSGGHGRRRCREGAAIQWVEVQYLHRARPLCHALLPCCQLQGRPCTTARQAGGQVPPGQPMPSQAIPRPGMGRQGWGRARLCWEAGASKQACLLPCPPMRQTGMLVTFCPPMRQTGMLVNLPSHEADRHACYLLPSHEADRYAC